MDIAALLGDDADELLGFTAQGIPADTLHLPGPDFVDRVFRVTDRSNQTLRSLEQLFGTGRLAGTGYVSILPVDQGIEHTAAASFAPNPAYFDPATSSNSPSREDATPWLRRSESSERCRASTPTRSRSS